MRRNTTASRSKMGSEDVPEEYMDVLFQEFAYDPVRLQHAEDPAQLLYNRRTLETIWVTKHEAVNPYTRQPFHIKNAIPQNELRQEMRQYITENRIKGLRVIPDYTKFLNESEMVALLKGLVYHYRYISQNSGKKEEDDWKAVWQKINLIRLYCEYGKWNRDLFSSIKGYRYLFMVADTQLQDYYSSSDEAKEVCRELARIVDIVGLRQSDLVKMPENSVRAFVHILYRLGKSEYSKIQSMVLNIYRRMFYYDIDYPLLKDGTVLPSCVIKITLGLLGRQNPADKIRDEDLWKGIAVLKAAWTWKRLTLLDSDDYVDVLVNVVILCISRYQEHLLASRHGGALCIDKALNGGFELIQDLLKAEDSEVSNYVYEKMRLEQLDIVKDIVRMVELVRVGFKFKPSHLRLGLIITAELLRSGRRQLREKEIAVFAGFLACDIVNKYSITVRQLLQDIIAMAA